MTIEFAVIHFGYLAVLLGTFFEGEIILIIGGFAAHRGYLELPLVIIMAFLGSLMGDQFYFMLGRRRGRAVLEKRPEWEARVARFKRLMDRHDIIIVIIFRFLYGLRTVAPFAIGLSSIPGVKFMLLNMVSAALWAVTLGILGYYFGHAMEAVIDDIKHYEVAVMSALALAAVMVYAVRHTRKKKADIHHTP